MPCMSMMVSAGELKSRDLKERGGSGSGSEMPSESSESSSIGMNSDEDEGDDEIQGPLRDQFMNSLEEALPIRRGISSFYNGKSKSFASLADASSQASIKGIIKPETAYSRRRRNLVAYTLLSDNKHHKNNNKSHLFKTHSGGVSKKPVSFASSSHQTTLALAVAMANTSKSSSSSSSNTNTHDCTSPPLSLRSFCHWRSFSLVDLHQCQHVGTTSNLRGSDRIS